MNMKNHARKVTAELIDLMDQGAVSSTILALELLGWLSESEVKEFAEKYGYIHEDEGE